MDGLPRNKKPINNMHERQNLALDDYLFERKMQQVFDKKESSDDMPKLLKHTAVKFKQLKSKLTSKRSKTVKTERRKKRSQLIDAPYSEGERFTRMISPKKKQITTDVKPKKRRTITKKTKRTSAIIGGFMLLLGLGFGLQMLDKPQKSGTKTPTDVKAAVSAQKPDFETLTPSTPAITPKIKFDPTKRVASYEDSIEQSRVVISQQRLGETELKDTEFLKRTAVNFNLKQEVTTKKGTAYIGANIDKNTQFAMFIYTDFLIFIQTEKTYKYQTLVDYIDALQ